MLQTRQLSLPIPVVLWSVSVRRAAANIGGGVLLLLLLLGGWFVINNMRPLNGTEAQELWQQQAATHYEVTIAWRSAWSYGHVQAEIKDGQIIGGTDLDSGRSLVPLNLDNAAYGANYYVYIDRLFALTDSLSFTPPGWRAQIARVHPLLAQVFEPCAPTRPQVRYDRTFGYPQQISYAGNVCQNGRGAVDVTIEDFRALP